jgi:site-specific DNA recombinase
MQSHRDHLKTLYYSELGRRAGEAMRDKVLSGLPSGRIPLGYAPSLKGDGLTIDILKAPYLIEAFEMVAGGGPLREVLARVTRLGLTSAKGNPLSLSTLQHLLRNPFYCGLVRYKGELFPGSHEPLVSKTLFDRAQKGLRKRRC